MGRETGWEDQDQRRSQWRRSSRAVQHLRNSLFFTDLHNTYTHTPRRENSATCHRNVNKEWPWVDSSQKRKYKRSKTCEKMLNYTHHVRKCMCIKPPWRYNFLSIRWAKIQTYDIISVGACVGEVQSIWKSIWQYTLKWQTHLALDLAILLLGIYPKTCLHTF